MPCVTGHVFISYSRTDRAYVDGLARFLSEAGLPCWYDFELVAVYLSCHGLLDSRGWVVFRQRTPLSPN